MKHAVVIRVLTYCGSEEWVRRTLDGGAVPENGTYEFSNGTCTIESQTFWPQAMSKMCSSCGTINDYSAKKCKSCGKEL